MKELDLSVYVLTESVPELRRTHEDSVLAATEGGATMIQFRDKTMGDREFAETAAKLLRLTRAAGVPLIVNDRIDVAIAIGADGVHVGRNDGNCAEIQKDLPAEMIFGVSATNYEEALRMDTLKAHYLGVGPVFPTSSKPDATPPTGIHELERICRTVRTPVVAIGGVTAENLPAILRAGAAGAAVISAVTRALHMTAATRQLKDACACCETSRK